jgi:hypothetical protein
MPELTDLAHELASRASDSLEEIRILLGDDEKSTEEARVEIDREDVLRDALHDDRDRNFVADGLRDFFGVALDVSPQEFTLVDIGREFELQHLNLLDVVRPSALKQHRGFSEFLENGI